MSTASGLDVKRVREGTTSENKKHAHAHRKLSIRRLRDKIKKDRKGMRYMVCDIWWEMQRIKIADAKEKERIMNESIYTS